MEQPPRLIYDRGDPGYERAYYSGLWEGCGSSEPALSDPERLGWPRVVVLSSAETRRLSLPLTLAASTAGTAAADQHERNGGGSEARSAFEIYRDAGFTQEPLPRVLISPLFWNIAPSPLAPLQYSRAKGY